MGKKRSVGIVFMIFVILFLHTFLCASSDDVTLMGASPKDYLYQGIEFGANGDTKEAEKSFRKIFKFYTSLLNIGYIETFLGPMARQGINICEDVTNQKLNKELAVSLFRAYWLAEMRNEIDEAISECKKVLFIAPNCIPARLFLSNLYIVNGKEDEGLNENKKAIAINPKDKEARYQLAFFYFARRNYALAESELTEVSTLSGKDVDVHLRLALVYTRMKKYELAIRHCQKAMDLGNKASSKILEEIKSYQNQ